MIKKKEKKKVKISKFSRLLYHLAIVLVFVSPLAIVFSKATLSQINFEVEQKKREIEKQEKNNASLAMAIDQLASLTKIQEVAQEAGLSYNNANIKVVQDK
ncbi:MAG: cell division protein FtsL [Bacilli bacterium]|nr:cell division protein FtsL [Bacilli bacterium]